MNEASSTPLPSYFGPDGGRLFGWLHMPVNNLTADVGMVICKPFGYESLCSHRSMRTFAEAAAAIGVPTLRFDYLGTGDSAEIAPDANQMEVWCNDVVAAVNELQARTGVSRVCLLGVRLGAALATLAAAKCACVNSLILIAPIVSGRRYLRELRLTQLAGSIHGDAGVPAARSDGSIEASGFILSAPSVAALEGMDLKTPHMHSVTDLLVIDGVTLPVAGAWSNSLRELGIRVRYQALPGLIEMIMAAPQSAVVPAAMISATSNWLAELTAGDRMLRQIEPVEDASTLRLPVPDTPSHFLLERPVFIDPPGHLFGIVTEPRQDETRRRAVIFLNSGADHHVGPSGVYVSLARRWALHGYVVLRLDLVGIGDSGTRPGQPDNEVFPPAFLEDIRDAIDFVSSTYDARDITLAGLCSGAYHALRAAAAGLPMNRILMVNPQNYFWKAGASLQDLQVAEVVRNPGVYRQRIFSASAWRRLLTGQVNTWRIFKIYVGRILLSLEVRLRDLARQLKLQLPHDLGSELEEIVSRGIRVVFVFSPGESGIDLLKLQGGSSVRRLGEKCRVYITADGNHVFSHRGSRIEMENILSQELFAVPTTAEDRDGGARAFSDKGKSYSSRAARAQRGVASRDL